MTYYSKRLARRYLVTQEDVRSVSGDVEKLAINHYMFAKSLCDKLRQTFK